MLPLPAFEWIAPTSLGELVRVLAEAPGETMLIAGGTDLVPNLKAGLYSPRRVVGLGRIAELQQIEIAPDGALALGAGVRIDRVATDPRVRARYPALADAAASVASPQIRRMATLGGNLLLDTRCAYYNQSAFWRGALGHCLKKDGDTCHVVPNGRHCVAAMSADTPAPLIAFGAEVELRSLRGTRVLPLARLYAGDGVTNHVRAPDEVLVQVRVPAPRPELASAYVKLRARQAIDFPLLSVAAVVDPEHVRIVVGALGALPRGVRLADDQLHARPLTPAMIDAIGAAAETQCHPLANLGGADWRQAVVGTAVKRALGALVPSTTAR